MKRIIILVMLLCGMCCGAEWWVAHDAAGGDGSESTPWTIAEAIAGSSSGDTIYMKDGTYSTVISTAVMLFTDKEYASTVTWQAVNTGAVIIDSTGDVTKMALQLSTSAADTQNLKFVGIHFKYNSNTANGSCVYCASSADDAIEDIEFEDCLFTTGSDGRHICYLRANTGTIQNITFDNCTMVNSSNNASIWTDATGTTGTVTITGGSLTTTSIGDVITSAGRHCVNRRIYT